MYYRATCSTAFRTKALIGIALMALICLSPRASVAQDMLPPQWLYSPITQVQTLAYSPDGTLLAVAGSGGASAGPPSSGIQIFSATTDTWLRCIPTAATSVNSIAFSQDGKTLAVGGYGVGFVGVLELWNVSDGTLITTLPTAANSYGSAIYSVAFSQDGKTLADGGYYDGYPYDSRGVLELWDVSTDTLTYSLPAGYPDYGVYSVAFSPDGKTLADGLGELWDVSTGTLITTLYPDWTNNGYSFLSCIAFSPDGKTLADGGAGENLSGMEFGDVELRNASTGKLIYSLPTATAFVSSVAFSSDGKTLADGGSGTQFGAVELWNASTGARLPSPPLVSGTGAVNSISFTPDGQVLFAGTQTSLQAFNMANYGLLSYYDQGTENNVTSVSVSPRGSLLAYGTYLGAIVVASNPYYNVALSSLTSISPNSAKEGGPAFTLTVKGSGFVTGATVNWNGAPLTTTFVSSKQLTASVPASDIAEAGTASITVENPGNVVSNALTFTIQAVAPTLTSLSPSSTTAGGAAFTLTVNGNHFVNGATVNWNGAALTTTFVSSTQLTASVPAANIASAGTASITATNPGTAASNALTFTIDNPKPVLTTISPNAAKHGSGSLTITLTGSSFLSGSVVNWTAGGTTTALATTYVSSTQLTATVTSALLASAGTATVTVFNPAPGGGKSAGKTFTIR